jgi:hypothetical protein
MPAEATVAQIPAPQIMATAFAEPQPSILQATAGNLKSHESFESLESFEFKASTAMPKQTATATPLPVEATAAQIHAPQLQATATVAKSQATIPQATTRNLEALEPLEILEPLESLASQSSMAVPKETTTTVPFMTTANPAETAIPLPFMPIAKPAESPVPLQPTATQMPAENIAVQIPTPQTETKVATATTQPTIPHAPAKNLESLESFESLESLEFKASTVAPKQTTTASATPAEPTVVHPSIPQPKAAAIIAEQPTTMAQAPSRNASAANQASTATSKPAEYTVAQQSAQQHKTTNTIAKPQSFAPHISSKHSESMETAIPMAAPSVPQNAIPQATTLDMPAITPATITKLALTPSEILASALNELTSAIMVNIDDAGHMNEIRLVLKPDVLDGTTILLKCDQKQISVTFFPGVESAEQLLMANQGRIAETLAATSHLPVQVSIINSEGRRQIRKSVA